MAGDTPFLTKQQALARLRSLVSEIWTAHRDHTDHEAYNECDVAECAWCEDTRKALAILESPDEPSPELPHVHLSKGGKDPNAKVYSARDVEALIAIALAAAKMPRKAAEASPVLPFIHWSKDPLIPYDGCTCPSCEGMRQYRTNLSGGTL
jgi:hypothetical protein